MITRKPFKKREESMSSPLIKEIIFCRHDTLKDRANLLKPIIISTILALVITTIGSQIFGQDLIVKELLIFLLSLIFSHFLLKKIYKNPVLFIPSLTLVILSTISMIESPQSTKWLILQLFSLIVINIIGSTRCNAMMFFLISISTIIPFTNGLDVNSFISSQLILFAIFPTMLYSSYHRTIQTIEKINNIQQLHDLEIEIIKREQFSQLAKISSIIAHEVNNALAVLNGNLMLLKIKFPDAEKSIIKAEKSSERIQYIVSLVKTKSFPVQETKEFNLSQAIKDEIMFLKLSTKNDSIEFDIDHVEENIHIFANETEIIQIFSNLVSNSVSALKDDPFINKVRLIKIYLNSLENNINLKVEDNGCGIPEKYKENIFKEGFTSKPKGEGTGLGLYLIKKLTEKYHGSINFTSSSMGTCFSVTFPKFNKGDDN